MIASIIKTELFSKILEYLSSPSLREMINTDSPLSAN